MIKYLEKTARTEDAAIAEALKELGLDRDDVSVEILERAKSGFLGIGASPARVRVSFEAPDEKPAPAPVKAEAPKPEKKAEPKAKPEKKAEAPKAVVKAAPADPNEPAEYAEIRAFLSGLLERMGVSAEMEISPRENGGVNVNLTGSAMGAIIGRRGETLDAIQHLTNYVVNKSTEKHLHISVDAEAYRSKREESLTKLAEKMAEKAIKYKRSMALEPMNSYERHVIHTALQNVEGVTTSSTGTEPNRRVVVSYVKPENGGEEKKAAPAEQPKSSGSKPQSREWA